MAKYVLDVFVPMSVWTVDTDLGKWSEGPDVLLEYKGGQQGVQVPHQLPDDRLQLLQQQHQQHSWASLLLKVTSVKRYR